MLSYQDNILHIEGKSLQKIAEETETPFFLLSESRIRRNYSALESGLSSSDVRIIIRYCAKTNNEAGVLSLLSDCGSDIMVSHLSEAQLALQCGYSPEKIAFQRPVLTEEEVQSVLKIGITFFHLHNIVINAVMEDYRIIYSHDIVSHGKTDIFTLFYTEMIPECIFNLRREVRIDGDPVRLLEMACPDNTLFGVHEYYISVFSLKTYRKLRL